MAQQPVTAGLDTDEGLLIAAPGNYETADYSFGPVPPGGATNGLGLTIVLDGGDGLIFYGPSVETGEGYVMIRCSVWTSGPDVALAMVGLNAPIDGSLVANMPVNGAAYMGEWHLFEVLYDPAGNSVMPAFQVVSTSDATTTVYVDQIEIIPIVSLDAGAMMAMFGMVTPTPGAAATSTIIPTPTQPQMSTATPTPTPLDETELAATRSLPVEFEPGAAFTVTLTLSVPESIVNNSGLAITETIPAGWTAAGIGGGGVWDAQNGQVKWLFLPGSPPPETITYAVTPPAGCTGTSAFSGVLDYTVDFAPQQAAVAGDSETTSHRACGC